MSGSVDCTVPGSLSGLAYLTAACPLEPGIETVALTSVKSDEMEDGCVVGLLKSPNCCCVSTPPVAAPPATPAAGVGIAVLP